MFLRADSNLQLLALLIGPAVLSLFDPWLVFFIYLGHSQISWKSKKKHIVSHSSAETDNIVLWSSCAANSNRLWYLLPDFRVSQTQPTFFFHNQAALHISSNPIFHEHTKHIEIDRYFVCDQIQAQRIAPAYIHTEYQPADIFTKELG